MKTFLCAGIAIALGLLSAGPVRAQVVISEFMASNGSILPDEDGDYPDWVELHNAGPEAVALSGWTLTDDPAQPKQWTFPATNLAAGRYLVVFASGKNRRVPGAPLHTGFRLGVNGDYLALLNPEGVVNFAFAPAYPPQATDVSYGLDPGLRLRTVLPTNAVGRLLVPSIGTLGTNWILPSFDDAGWQVVTSAVGYVVGTLDRLPVSGLTNRLGAYWKFDETSGTIAADATGQGGIGTLLSFPTNNSQWGPGRNDGALRFRGPAGGDYVRVASYPRASNAITIAAWVFAESRPTWASIAKNWAGTGGQFHFGLRDTGGDLDIFITTTGGQFSLREGRELPTNQWQHVAFTADGTSLRLYRNGVEVGNTPYTGTLVVPPVAAMSIGVKLNNAGTAADTGSPGYWHGRIDDVGLWHRALDPSEVRAIASAGELPGVSLGGDVRASMFGVNASALLRFPFVLENPVELTRWRLKMRYDDGFVAWINGEEIVRRNAPESLVWNAAATAERPAQELAAAEEFNLAEFAPFMVAGTNVLAIQALNHSADDLDFLMQPVLEASSITDTTNAHVYFTTPTPGAENSVGVEVLGPIISRVTHAPKQPADADDLTVTARVMPTFAPIASVALQYRIQFSAPVTVAMFDDGAHGDGGAADGTYGARIPASASTNGQLIRYAVLATDVRNVSARLPIFNSPTDSDEYLGTVVLDPAVQTTLPVFHWFVATPALAELPTGTRCSLFYDGELYDNIFVRIRGGTSRGWPKKSYKIELNEDHEFALKAGGPRVTEFDFNTTYTDKSYLRSVLTYEHQRDAGLPSPIVFLAQLRQNSVFYNLTVYTEQPDKDFLKRVGLDPSGTLYKCGPGSTYDSVTGFEKKTRLTEGNTNVLILLQNLGLSGAALEQFVFDQIDVPGMVNFMATVAITQNIDATDKNHFLYQDTDGTGEWRMLPWDQDLTFGPNALNTDAIVFDQQVTNGPSCASHPFIGARPYLLAAGKYNRLIESFMKVPRAREMLMRRIRTFSDQYLATGYFQRRMDELAAVIGPDVLLDKARWGGNVSFGGNTHTLVQAINRIKSEYLAPRLGYLTGPNIAGVGPANPTAQPPNVDVRIHSVEFNPASGNQAQEFVCITNASGFPVDVSGWRLDAGIQFTFPPGAVLTSNGVVYVAAEARSFRARTSGPRGGQSLFVLGNFSGRLSARGENLVLRNQYGQPAQTYVYPGAPSNAQRFLRITEVMYHPSALAGNPTDAEEFEYVELQNVSDATAINLAGVRFLNGIEFDFTGSAVTTLGPGETALVVRNRAAFVARYGAGVASSIAGEFSGALENGGERLLLVDAAGEEILDFTYDNDWHPITDGLGFSLVAKDRLAEPDAWGRRTHWQPSGTLDGSPGRGESPPNAIAPMVISEALSRSDVPPPLDAIELHNPTGGSVDISGWYLSDDFNAPRKFRIPAGTILPGGGYRVFDESQFNGGPGAFALSSDGDEVWLFSADAAGNLTGYVHGHRFGAADDGVTFGRLVTSDGREYFAPQAARTLGAENVAPAIGPVVISELHYHPPDQAGDDNTADEFVELRNITGQTVELFDAVRPTNTWQLSGGVAFQFPAGRTLAAGETLLIVNFDPANATAAAAFRARFGIPAGVALHGPFSGKLDNSSDQVVLQRPTTPVGGRVPMVWIDGLDYADAGSWPAGADGLGMSLQRRDPAGFGPEPRSWVAAPPTAGRVGPPAGAGGPVISTAPSSRTELAYGTIQFAVAAAATPAPRYQWHFNGVPIPGATNSSLLLNNVQPAQAGDYAVLVYNLNGSVLSTNATLTLLYPAFILQQPSTVLVRVRPDPQAAPVTNATFRTAAFSPTPLSYQWRYNGQDIPGATASTLTVSNVQVSSAGEYTVRITDAVGDVLSAPASLVPLVSPVLLQVPLAQLVTPGSLVTLSASATGVPLPLSFEWRRGSLPLATNTVFSTVSSFQFSAPPLPFVTNQYRVVVRNLATVSPLASPLINVITLPDFDQDGLIDLYEQSIGLNTNNAADALLDPDGDGMSTLAEYVAGTDPLNPDSVLRVAPLSLLPPEVAPGVEFPASSNRTYTVQFTDRVGDVGNPGWTKLREIVAAPTNRTERVSDVAGAGLTNRFYRVVTPAQP